MKSYKTTIAGFAVAVLNLIANGVKFWQAIFSASMVVLGLMAKDYDVSSKDAPEKIIDEANAQKDYRAFREHP